ncbi:DNA polymerase A [Stappia phage SI01]|uniref:DNA polymerase A n=1 Tax=Stappia phage SI01 TaxID=2847766 RepID=A0AAE7SQ30_9CAUD|nr:DNA polymerase A [Stappia phage SI01]
MTVDIAALAAKAAETEDQTQEVSHTEFDNTPEEGLTVGRLIGYVELGKHDGGEYNGKKKPDAERVRIEFELLGPNNMITFERDGKEVTMGQQVSVEMKKSLSDKAKFKKLFKKLQYGRDDKKHIAQMLGEAYIMHIYHNKGKNAAGKEVLYVNLDKDGEFAISAPFQVDPITKQKQMYNIAPATQPLRLFLWDHPVREMWDSLFIDGSREVKNADGTTTSVSKNWMQERIMSAKNFAGSPIHVLLSGVSAEDIAAAEEAASEAAAPSATQDTGPAEEVAQSAPEAQEEASAPVAEEANADPLAALGLTVG